MLCTWERGCDRERASGTKAEWSRAAGVSLNRWLEGTPAIFLTHYPLKCSVRDTQSGRSRAWSIRKGVSRSSQSLTREGNDRYPPLKKNFPLYRLFYALSVDITINQDARGRSIFPRLLTAARNCAEWFFRHITSHRVFFFPFFFLFRGVY